MEACCHTEFIVNVYRYDPTQTTMLRNNMTKLSNRLYNELSKRIYQAIKYNSISGLYKYLSNTEKLNEFQRWIDRQINDILLSDWHSKYLYNAYIRGVIRARKEMIKAGYKVPTIAQSGGIDTIMMNPFHKEMLSLLKANVLSEIKNLSSQMSQQLIRVLSQGLANNDKSLNIARRMVSVIKGTGKELMSIKNILGKFVPAKLRSELMSRTEIIRTHHKAMVAEYKNWNVQKFNVMAEFRTAGDNRVCSICATLEGQIFTIEKINDLIPVHPRCRCIAIPIKVKGGK